MDGQVEPITNEGVQSILTRAYFTQMHVLKRERELEEIKM